MSFVSTILALVVALEHLYIMYLETLATTSAKTAKTFGVSGAVLEDPFIQTLFKNQGVYNGLFAVGILYGLFISNSLEIVTLFIVFVIVAALYGALTSSKRILIKQGAPAIVTLISLLLLG